MNGITSLNFNCLYTRLKHEHLSVKNGLIKKLSGFDRLHYLISHKYRESVQKNLNLEITQILKNIDKSIGNSTEDTKKIYKAFVFDKLASLNTKIFNREVFNKPECCHLVKLLDEDYQQIDVETDFTQDEAYLHKVESVAKFALKLGIKPERVEEGSSGTYFLKDLSNRNIAVFKPEDEEPLAKNSTKFSSQAKRLLLNIIRRIVNWFQTAIFCCSGNAHKAEAAAWIISQQLGLNNVPLTKVTTLEYPHLKNNKIKKGSIQVFVNIQELVSAEKLLKIPYLWCSFPQLARWHFNHEAEINRLHALIPQDEFEKMVLIDIALGNLDRHPRNWLFARKKIYCIDNGYSLPNKHTDSRVTGKNQYIWSFLPYANQTFSAKSKEIIQHMKIQLPFIVQRLKQEELVDDDQVERMCERVAMLIVKQHLTMREIAKYKSTCNFKDLESDKYYLEVLNSLKSACKFEF